MFLEFSYFIIIEAVLAVEQTELFKLATNGKFTIEGENKCTVKNQRLGKGLNKLLKYKSLLACFWFD